MSRSRDRNFSFPSYINRYYDDPIFKKIVDAMYDVIHSGEFSAKHLREAVTLAENKEIMYGKRVMPTATTGPMPGDRPKATDPDPRKPAAEKEHASHLDTPLTETELAKCHVHAQLGSSTGGLIWGDMAERMIREIRAYRALAKPTDSGRSSGFETDIYAIGISSIIPMFSNAKSITITDITEPNSASSALKLFKVIGEWPTGIRP